jgi:hypothetical protein
VLLEKIYQYFEIYFPFLSRPDPLNRPVCLFYHHPCAPCWPTGQRAVPWRMDHLTRRFAPKCAGTHPCPIAAATTASDRPSSPANRCRAAPVRLWSRVNHSRAGSARPAEPLPPVGRGRRCANPPEHLLPDKPGRTKHRATHPTISRLACRALDLGCRSPPPACTAPSPIGVGPAWSADKPQEDSTALSTDPSFQTPPLPPAQRSPAPAPHAPCRSSRPWPSRAAQVTHL